MAKSDGVPDAAGWRRGDPAAFGFDPAALVEAAAFAESRETPWRRDLAQQIGSGHFEKPPWNEIIGPVRPRGGPNGLVIRRGEIVASWGDTRQVDMTFSVA